MRNGEGVSADDCGLQASALCDQFRMIPTEMVHESLVVKVVTAGNRGDRFQCRGVHLQRGQEQTPVLLAPDTSDAQRTAALADTVVRPQRLQPFGAVQANPTPHHVDVEIHLTGNLPVAKPGFMQLDHPLPLGEWVGSVLPFSLGLFCGHGEMRFWSGRCQATARDLRLDKEAV